MIISIIAAMAENRVIGRGTDIPWDLADDRRRFREITWGHLMIMGRRTFESIGPPLAGRTTIVLSHDTGYRPEGALAARDLETALSLAGKESEVFICGGEEVYRQAMPLADRIYLTIIHQDFEGDVFFPDIPADFIEEAREFVPEPVPHTFILFGRGTGVKKTAD